MFFHVSQKFVDFFFMEKGKVACMGLTMEFCTQFCFLGHQSQLQIHLRTLVHNIAKS